MQLKCLKFGIVILVLVGLWQVGVGQEPGTKKKGCDIFSLVSATVAPLARSF